MEGFTYHNIFDTKGIEYLIIIGFFLVLIPFWMFLNKKKNPLQKAKEIISLSLRQLRIPQGYLFSKNHTWLHMKKNGLAKVGLDDMILHLTGQAKVDFAVESGSKVKKGDLIAQIKQDDKNLKILSPISGVIRGENSSLEESVTLASLPVDQGWLVEVEPTNWLSEIVNFKIANDASEWLKKEMNLFKDYVSSSPQGKKDQVVLQDGGEIQEQTLSRLSGKEWDEFQKKFLNQVD